MMDKEKKYTIDDRPVTAIELIHEASSAGYFDDPSFKTTSEAASILRGFGHTVGFSPPE